MSDLNAADVEAEMLRRLKARAAAAGQQAPDNALSFLNPQALETLRREAEETLRGERGEHE
ncbi:MAG: hypothetical protein INR70_00475 [Parafilimonas terrae]|nr:hypothetical protein [Parafilimonas terrae]